MLLSSSEWLWITHFILPLRGFFRDRTFKKPQANESLEISMISEPATCQEVFLSCRCKEHFQILLVRTIFVWQNIDSSLRLPCNQTRLEILLSLLLVLELSSWSSWSSLLLLMMMTVSLSSSLFAVTKPVLKQCEEC